MSTINTVVAGLLHIHAIHLRQFFTNPSIFYHPGIKNCMAVDASRLFEFYDTSLLDHMYAAYPQPKILWQIYLPPPDILICMISTLHRKPYERELHKMLDI